MIGVGQPSYELRMRILQRKLEDWQAEYPEFVIEPGVLERIARLVTGDIRCLEGALQRLLATASFLHRGTITGELVDHVLSDLTPSAEPVLEIDDIIGTVAEHLHWPTATEVNPGCERSKAPPIPFPCPEHDLQILMQMRRVKHDRTTHVFCQAVNRFSPERGAGTGLCVKSSRNYATQTGR